MHVVGGGWFVYMGGYSIAPKSLRAHKSDVFCETTESSEEEDGMEREGEGHKSRELQRMLGFTLFDADYPE